MPTEPDKPKRGITIEQLIKWSEENPEAAKAQAERSKSQAGRLDGMVARIMRAQAPTAFTKATELIDQRNDELNRTLARITAQDMENRVRKARAEEATIKMADTLEDQIQLLQAQNEQLKSIIDIQSDQLKHAQEQAERAAAKVTFSEKQSRNDRRVTLFTTILAIVISAGAWLRPQSPPAPVQPISKPKIESKPEPAKSKTNPEPPRRIPSSH